MRILTKSFRIEKIDKNRPYKAHAMAKPQITHYLGSPLFS